MDNQERDLLDEQELLYPKEYNKRHINIAVWFGFIVGVLCLLMVEYIIAQLRYLLHN